MSKNTARENNGQYALDGNWDRLCVCGHRLGDHFGASPRNCCIDDSEEHCVKFRQSNKNPAAVSLGKLGGSIKSKKKAKSSAENGKKGGRPKKVLSANQSI